MSGTELDENGFDTYHADRPWEQVGHPDYLPPSEPDPRWKPGVLRAIRERIERPSLIGRRSRRERAEADRQYLMVEVDRLSASLDSMDHFADVAERVERRNNVLRAENDALRAQVAAVQALVANVGNESTGPEFVACYEVRDAIENATANGA